MTLNGMQELYEITNCLSCLPKGYLLKDCQIKFQILLVPLR